VILRGSPISDLNNGLIVLRTNSLSAYEHNKINTKHLHTAVLQVYAVFKKELEVLVLCRNTIIRS